MRKPTCTTSTAFTHQLNWRQLGVSKYFATGHKKCCRKKIRKNISPHSLNFHKVFRLKNFLTNEQMENVFLTWTCDGKYLISYKTCGGSDKMFFSFWSLEFSEKSKLIEHRVPFEFDVQGVSFLEENNLETMYIVWVHQHKNCDFLVFSSIEYDKLDSLENMEVTLSINNIPRPDCSTCKVEQSLPRVGKCLEHSYNLLLKMIVVGGPNCETRGFRLYLLPQGGIILNSGIGIHCFLWTLVAKVCDISKEFLVAKRITKICGLNETKTECGSSLRSSGLAGAYLCDPPFLYKETIFYEECFVDLEPIICDVSSIALAKIGQKFSFIEDYESLVGEIDYSLSTVHISCVYLIRSQSYCLYEGGFDLCVDYGCKCLIRFNIWDNCQLRSEKWKKDGWLDAKNLMFSLEDKSALESKGYVCNNIPVISGETLVCLENPSKTIRIVL